MHKSEQKHKQGILEGGMILTVALLVIKLLGWAYQILLTRVIGVTGYGYYSFANNFYGVVYAIAVTGFPIAMSKVVSEYATQGRYKDIQHTEKVANRLYLVIGIAGTLFVLLFAPVYARVFLNNSDLVWAMWVLAPSILFCCLMSVPRGYNQGMSNMTPTAVSQVIEVLVKVAVGLLGATLVYRYFTSEYERLGTVMGKAVAQSDAGALTLALGAAGAMIGVTASAVASWGFLAVRRWWRGDGLRKAQINDSPEPHSNRQTLKAILVVAVPISLSAAVANLSGIIDNSMVSTILPRLLSEAKDAVFASHNGLLEQALEVETTFEELPAYMFGASSMHSKLVTLITALTGSFGMSALPLVSSSWTQHDTLATKKNIDASMRITMLIAAPAGISITVLAEPISWLVFKSNPIGAALGIPMLRVMGIVAILMALMGIINAMLQAVGRADVPIKLLVIGLVIKTVSNYLLVSAPSINIKGLPVGNLLCYLFICVFGLWILSRSTALKIDFKGTLSKPILAGSLTAAFAWLVYEGAYFLLDNSSWSSVIAILCAVAFYVVLIGVFKMIERDDVLSLPGGEKLAATLEKLKVLR